MPGIFPADEMQDRQGRHLECGQRRLEKISRGFKRLLGRTFIPCGATFFGGMRTWFTLSIDSIAK
jgi:hypothetical protein